MCASRFLRQAPIGQPSQAHVTVFSRRSTLVGCVLALLLGAGWFLRLVDPASAGTETPSLTGVEVGQALPSWLRETRERVETLTRVHEARLLASSSLHAALHSAGLKAESNTHDLWWSLALERASSRHWEAAHRLARLSFSQAEASDDQASALRLAAWAAVQLDMAEDASSALDDLAALAPDEAARGFDDLLCAHVRSLEGRHDEASACAQRVYLLNGHHAFALELEMALIRRRLRDTPSPEAINEARRLQRRFPEYPNPDGFALDLASALERTGNLQEAAVLLEARLFEAPWRRSAPALESALDALVARGAQRPRRSLQQRLEQGQAVRFARHWPLAERRLAAVHADALASGATREFIGRVQFQRMLNAYEDQRYRDAELLAAERIAAGFAGSPPRLVLLTYLRTISRQAGRITEAWEETQRLAERYPVYLTQAHVEEMAFDFGFYADALQIAQSRRSAAWMRGFAGIFLRYLAGDPSSAADFETLATRVRGEASDRARYWGARSHARNGDRATARRIFQGLVDADRGRAVPGNFYRMAARWRLQDLAALEDHGPDPHPGRPPYAPPPAADPETPVAATDVDLARTTSNDSPSVSKSAEAGAAPPLDPTRRVALGERPAWGPTSLGGQEPAILHWGGRSSPTPADFRNTAESHAALLASPLLPRMERVARLRAFAERWGEEFPDAELSALLLSLGLDEEARRVFRHVLVEERQLRVAGQRTSLPLRSPLALPARLHAHLIDHRRSARGWMGVGLQTARFPVPAEASARTLLSARQTRLLRGREALRDDLIEATIALEDAHFLRRFALAHSTMPDRNRHIHGRAYATTMIDHTRAHNLSPWLMWALMIVESDLNPDSVSVADAYGLLQVIPRTGELMALRLEEPDFGIHQLLDPAESIRYGTAYLREALDKFHGQEILALVGYNAGPHQVARWLDWRGDLLAADEWLETLPFASARAYAHNIVRLMAAYSHAYGQDVELYLGNQLRADYLDNIYF